MKAFNILFCILFIVAAALQYNDVDPFIWIPIYLYGAALCFITARGRYVPKAYLYGIIIYLCFIAYFLIFKHGVLDWVQHHPANDLVRTMKADKPWIEETREVMGLSILVIVLAIDWIAAKRRRYKTASPQAR
jgi:hypothetical protein